ncbi:MAG TPA: acetolactate synthase small subunit [Porphyromonadaceae bacterium]|jgi:acetolactate synthase-1/3 small subunit|nr:acetolactate synthase small subunit [Porphyromonadaceae bacterium]
MTHPERQLFTVTVYSENCVGLLNQVSVIFTRRCLNIEDVSASASSVPDIHKLTLTTWADRPTMEKVVRQIEKRVDVIRAFLYTDDDIVYQEVALYKVPTARLLESGAVEDIVRHHGARILEMTPDYTVIEKSGHPWETEALLNRLRSLDIRQFVRSGRVAVTKSPVEHVDIYIEEQRQRQLKLQCK